MDLSTKNRRGLLAGTAALILVIGVLAVLIYRADPASSKTESLPVAAETPAPVVTPAVAATTVPATSPSPVPQQTATEVQAAASDNNTLPPISPEVAAEIQRLSIQNSEGLVAVKQADGSVSMNMQGHFQSVTAAAIGADGKLVIRHGEEFLNNVE